MLQNQHKNRTNSKPVSKPLFGTERKILLLVITSIFSTALFTVFVFHHYLSSDLNYRILSRSDAIFSLLLSRIPAQSVTDINTPDDSHEILYKRVQTLLDGVRKTTAVRYLYTAKRNAEGRAIYVVDGLPPDSEDFRQAGNLIEDEVAPVANICLDGKSFLGTKVIDPSWGKIIPACEPIKLNGITVGALIIEFDVNSFAESARRSSLICLAFSIGFAMAAATVTTWLLRKLSVPLYRKLAYTDLLTGTLNRNAFEEKIRKIDEECQQDGLVILTCDINMLKTINDQGGHAAGDAHICALARLLESHLMAFGKTYRIGGDEFASLLYNLPPEKLEEKMKNLFSLTQKMQISGFRLEFAYGMAQFDSRQDKDVQNTLKRADARMYAHKSLLKQTGSNTL